MPSIRRTTKLTANREVTVLRRYLIKVDFNDLRKGDIVLIVRNDKGVEYTVKLRRNKRHECTCPSRKPCYHIKAMVSVENARWQAECDAVTTTKAETVEETYVMSNALHAKLATLPPVVEEKAVTFFDELRGCECYVLTGTPVRRAVTFFDKIKGCECYVLTGELVEAKDRNMAAKVAAKVGQAKKSYENAPLNGNRGFSLMR